ncbi:MAG: SRPBCC domain-containing protein [Asticcacaulis sp.]
MNATTDSATKAERTSDREFVVKRTVNGPARLVYKAWSEPELFRKWWTPKSFGMTILSCEMDVRTGGGYTRRWPCGGSGWRPVRDPRRQSGPRG